MTVERQILSRWRYPNSDILRNRVFASGRPPFAPFPTISSLVNGNHCPVALYHDLIHGDENALSNPYPLSRREELFRKFIAYLKLSVRNCNVDFSVNTYSHQQAIQAMFLRFNQAHGFPLSMGNDIWRLYVEPWVTRKLQNGELQDMSSDEQFFFDISVSNARTLFPLNKGIRHYPLRGKIDEINLSRRRIIERTIRGECDDENPPFLREYRIWLLWKILCSLEGEQLPSSWGNLCFNDFEIFIETPYRDFAITDNPEFIMDTHWAYAWVNDISISEPPGVFREVFENAQCAPENAHPYCEHAFKNCFPHRYPHPQSRPEIRQAFQPWYRLLLWEQMWKGHLWYYQLLMLNRQELTDLGLIVETQVVSLQDNQIELELIGRESNQLRAYEYCTVIPYGTVFCGLKLDARLTRMENTRIFLQFDNMLSAISEEALLILSPDIPAPVMKEPPTFLDRNTQHALFKLMHMGARSEQAAQTRSLIQLLEAVFGTRPIRRERR